MSEQQRVLVVMGPESRAAAMARALTHRQAHVATAYNEQGVLAALSESQYDLAVVGGRIGRRGPLITCEAVRVRQPGLRVVVLIDSEVDEATLAQHQARGLEGLSYLDVRHIPSEGDGALEIGEQVRNTVLALLQLEEDPAGRNSWIDAEAAAATESPVAASIPDAGQPEPPVAQTDDLIAGRDPGPVTAEDLAFADRVAEQVKQVDFRASRPQPSLAMESGPERMVTRLRNKVRDLEWQLARLAYIYTDRRAAGSNAAERLQQVEAALNVAEEERERLRTSVEQENANLATARAARAAADERYQEALAAQEQLRAEVEKVKQERIEVEQKLTAMLEETGEALGAVRDQSTAARSEWEAQLDERRQELEAAMRMADEAGKKARDLREELEAAKRREVALVDESQATQAAIRQQAQAREAELIEDMRRTDEARREREEELLAQLQQATEAQAERERELLAELRGATESSAERDVALRAALDEAAQRRRELQEQLAETQQAQKLRAIEAQEELIREKAKLDAEVAGLRAHVEHDEAEAASLRQTVSTLRDQIDKLHADLRNEEARRGREVAAAGEQFEEVGKLWEDRTSKIKEKTQALHDRITVLDTAMAAKELEIAQLKGEIGAREDQIAQLEKANKEANNALARERIGFAEALDAKLSELERFARESSERMVRLVEALLALDERSRRQEELTQKLLGGMTEDGEVIDASAPAALRGQHRAARFQARPLLIGASAGGLAVLLVVIIFAMVWTPSASVAPEAATQSATNVDEEPGATLAVRPLAARGKAAPEKPTRKLATKPETKKPDAAKPDAPKPDASKPAAKKPSTKAPAAPKPDATKPDTAKPIATGPLAKPTLSKSQQADRKRIRTAMMAAHKTKKFKTAALLGRKLRDQYYLDWEPEYLLADALRRSGAIDEAIETYKGFVARYPTNLYADNAAWWAANLLLKRGDKTAAIRYYEIVAKDRSSDFKSKAKRQLEGLR